MRVRRYCPGLRSALVSSHVIACLLVVAPIANFAQQKTTTQSAAEQPAGVTAAATPITTQPTPAQPVTSPATGTNFGAGTPASGGAAAAATFGDEQLIVNSDLITLSVTLTDAYGRFVTGLTKEAFTVLDDKESQDISFFSDEDAPVSLGVIFDVSGSMGKDKIAKARDALKHFIETSHDGDEYFLIGFNHRSQVLMEKTRDADALLTKLTFVQTKGQTALYDACYLGVEKVTRGAHPKRALLIISDGQDNSSRYTFSELRRVLKETDVLIYAIGITDKGDPNGLGVSGQAVLDELAGVSGGRAFFPDTAAEMNEIFERIAIELRHQYSIGYKPKNFVNNGKWHKIKVKVSPPRGLPRVFVRTKEGYYATTQPR
ncbi:MAG TPA: VWA domain-containing protein [Pyrinomonadaceae bacterium]|jgi:Ca-activated chloride channel family protein|nr:VWA domain-containing protein [Pyrinomonadaceae bacterium]